MMTNADKTVLKEAIKNSRMAVESIQTILNRVYDDDLAFELNCQADKYEKIQQKAVKKLKAFGIQRQEASVPQKVMLKSTIQAKTLMNTKTEHIADMMIQGSTKGINELTQIMHQNRSASKTVCEIANELVDFEEKNIERLKTYL